MDQEHIDNAVEQESSVNWINLRDKFAKDILVSLLTSSNQLNPETRKTYSDLVDIAYNIANRMMERRKTL